jgi:serine/threonine protein kinase
MSDPQAVTAGSPISIGAVEAMILANGWAGPSHIERIRPLVKDGRQLIRSLVDQRIAPPECIAQFDLLIHIQAQLPEFQILKKLGAGGMGTVYLATHLETGNEVALKVISARLAGDSEFLGRFHRETEALMGLRHPHLANIIARGHTGQTHYLAMDHINGPSLSAMLKEYRALPEDYALRLLRQVAECLNYVSTSAGLVHRDIKPENILVQRVSTSGDLFPIDDEAKLIDFGLVKSADDDEHLTQTGMTIGTPLYMSPEQVRGEKLDCRSDIYGLGATLYHLITGSPPFKGTSPGTIMSSHLTDPVPDPGSLVPSLSAETRRLVTISMSKKVDDRFRSFDAMIKACDAALAVVAERSGGSIKLLRKPLVIHNSKKVAPTGGAGPSNPAAPTGSGAKRSVSERIQLKDAERKQAKVAGQFDGAEGSAKPGSHPSVPTNHVGTSTHAPSDAAAGGVATDALVKAHSDRIRKRQELPKAKVEEADLSQSAVFAEDSASQTGTGPLPWIFLSLAIAVSIGYIIYRLRSG